MEAIIILLFRNIIVANPAIPRQFYFLDPAILFSG